MIVQLQCPCCGSPIDDFGIEQLIHLKWSDIQSDIIDKLVTDYPRRTRWEDLIAYVYAFRDEPESQSLQVILTTVRKKLLKVGWQIGSNRAGKGNTAKYKLEKVNTMTEKQRPLVIIESPYAGDVEANTEYARSCVKDSLMRGEAPIASHLLYTQPGILDDTIPEERQLGIDAGLEWRRVSDKTVVYMDKGLSKGMEYGIEKAKTDGKEIIYRWLEE